MSKKNLNKPLFGPEIPPKREDTLKGGLTKEGFNELWMPFITKIVYEAGGVEALLRKNPELILKLQKFQATSGERAAQWVHKNCPGMEQESPEKIQASFQQTISAASSSATETSDIELVGQESSEESDS